MFASMAGFSTRGMVLQFAWMNGGHHPPGSSGPHGACAPAPAADMSSDNALAHMKRADIRAS
jgi:hypothetical protein